MPVLNNLSGIVHDPETRELTINHYDSGCNPTTTNLGLSSGVVLKVQSGPGGRKDLSYTASSSLSGDSLLLKANMDKVELQFDEVLLDEEENWTILYIGLGDLRDCFSEEIHIGFETVEVSIKQSSIGGEEILEICKD